MARSSLAESQAIAQRVLFIDRNNHSGSRFCEELFNHLVTAAGANWLAYSRALSRTPAWHTSGPMCPIAIEALRRRRIRIGDRMRLPLECSNLDVIVADLAIAIEEPREDRLDARWPKTRVPLRYWTPDPAGLTAFATLGWLDRSVRALIAEITVPRAAPAARPSTRKQRAEVFLAPSTKLLAT